MYRVWRRKSSNSKTVNCCLLSEKTQKTIPSCKTHNLNKTQPPSKETRSASTFDLFLFFRFSRAHSPTLSWTREQHRLCGKWRHEFCSICWMLSYRIRVSVTTSYSAFTNVRCVQANWLELFPQSNENEFLVSSRTLSCVNVELRPKETFVLQ